MTAVQEQSVVDGIKNIDKHPDGQRPTLLAVLAHPDDETFGMGGTLALYARRGYAVHLVCATHGEVGEVEAEQMKGYASIADLREHELMCAASQLGLSEVHFLKYRDSGMPGSPDNQHPQALFAAPMEQVVGDVVASIRQIRPQVVITFDPIGGYRHPDHITIQRATVKAFALAGDANAYPDDLPAYAPQRLFFHTISKRFLRFAVRMLPFIGMNPHQFGKNKDIDLASLVAEDFPVNAVIDYRSVAKVRDAAARCHASQGGAAMTQGFQGWVMRLSGANELFTQAYPDPDSSGVSHDLFAGVDVSS